MYDTKFLYAHSLPMLKDTIILHVHFITGMQNTLLFADAHFITL